MIESTFDSYLLHTNSENSWKSNEILETQKLLNNSELSQSFEIVELQIDNSLMLEDEELADLNENKLKKANLMFKIREKLIIINSIKFNDE